MSSTKEIVEVQIKDIIADPSFQARFKLDRGQIKRYATVYRSEKHTMPPIELADVEGVLYLVDGWHRLEAQKGINGTNETVKAVVHHMNISEARWRSALSNLSHGLPLKPKEIRNVFKIYIKTRKHRKADGTLKSYREIASDLEGIVAYTTIRNWMKADFPKLFSKYSGESSGASLDGPKEVDTVEENLKKAADDALATLSTAYKGLKDLGSKGVLVELTERVLREMKAMPYEVNGDF